MSPIYVSPTICASICRNESAAIPYISTCNQLVTLAGKNCGRTFFTTLATKLTHGRKEAAPKREVAQREDESKEAEKAGEGGLSVGGGGVERWNKRR